MTDAAQHDAPRPRGFTKEMRAARAVQLAGVNPAPPQAQQAAQSPSAANQGLEGASASPLPSDALPVGAGVTADASSDAPRRTRANRRPFGSTQQKLAYPSRPGYYRHWFVDNPGRIEFALEEGGWTPVKDARGKNVQRVTGVREGGVPQYSHLLEIPEEWHADDMAAQEQDVAQREDAIRRGMVNAKDAVDQKRFYPSSEGRGIKISTTHARR